MEMQQEHKEQLRSKELEHTRLQNAKDIEIARLQASLQRLENQVQMLSNFTKDAINRPTTISTTNNQQNIASVKITNHLANHKSYLAQLHPERVRNKLDQHLENYFFAGQQGLARFVVEHIIKMDDDKFILVCTDTSRKRFRFVNAEEELAEDMRAKILCSKLKTPVREMCNEVFDRVIARLKSEKKVQISQGAGAFDIDFLDKKLEYAEKKFIEIRSFDSEDNTDFLNELATLLRNPTEDDMKE